MRRISLHLAVVFTAVALLAGLWIGQGSAATLAAPGSDQDPLVTKSYVDQAINNLAALIDNIFPGEPGTPPPTTATSLRVVQVAAGERLIASEGSEFILRSGNATAIGGTGGGIPDLTAGKDLPNNTAIPANHLLLFPRSDQRGIRATTNIIVMVRGEYTIEP